MRKYGGHLGQVRMTHGRLGACATKTAYCTGFSQSGLLSFEFEDWKWAERGESGYSRGSQQTRYIWGCVDMQMQRVTEALRPHIALPLLLTATHA